MITISHDGPFTEAVEAIKGGGVVAYPTETFYGLAVDATNKAAVEELFRLKERSSQSPISVIVPDMDMARALIKEVPPVAERLAAMYWPGPITLVFNARAEVLPALTAGSGKIGIRISSCRPATRLSEEAGRPITATSANPCCYSAASDASEVEEYFGKKIQVLIDGGHLEPSLPSTVVDVTTEPVEIVRTGAIDSSDIFHALRV